MARGGINRAVVQKARQSLLVKGENPSIDAVRIELGNTGSKTTIHRYLKEIEELDPRPESLQERLSEELNALVANLLGRLKEEGSEATVAAQARFDAQRASLEVRLEDAESALLALQRQFGVQQVALEAVTSELQISHSSLQTEMTRNARLSQTCSDLEVRVVEKDEQVRSLEEKHVHARDALEHYRNAVKEQREQEQRRHEGQLQQVQVELRQLQQIQMLKQDELTRLNRDNERLLAEARHQVKTIATQDDAVQRLNGEINTLKSSVAKADGAREMLKEQVAQLRTDAKQLAEALSLADEKNTITRALLDESNTALATLRLDQSSLAQTGLDQPPQDDQN